MRVSRAMALRARPLSDGGAALRGLTRRDVVKSMTVAAGAVVFAGYGRAPRTAAQGQTQLTQWYHLYGEAGTQEAAQRYAEGYTAVNPDVVVEMVWQPGDYMANVLPAALLTNDGPDVFEASPLSVAMVRAGQAAPLDDLFTPEIRGDFNPANLDVNTVDGSIYAVKMVDDMGLLYARTSILGEAGVQPPTTMDEVIAASSALDTGRVKGLFLGNDGGVSAMITIAPWSAGSDFLDPATNQITFNNERTAAAYQKVVELNQTGALLVGAPTDWWDPSAFTQGLTAMQWTGLWAMPQIQREVPDDFTVTPWPMLDAQGTPTTFWGGWSECVNAKSQNIDAAKQFVKWLWIDSVDLQRDWNLSYGFHVPPRLSAASAAEPLQSGPASEAVGFLGQYGKILPPQWTQAMTTTITDALAGMINDGTPPAEAVAAAAQRCQAELDQQASA